MNTIAKLTATISTAALLCVGFASAAPAQQEGPSLACATTEDCIVVIDTLYPQIVDLGAEVNALRKIRDKADRRIEYKQETIDRLREKVRNR